MELFVRNGASRTESFETYENKMSKDLLDEIHGRFEYKQEYCVLLDSSGKEMHLGDDIYETEYMIKLDKKAAASDYLKSRGVSFDVETFVCCEDIDIISMFLDAGMDINAKNKYGWTALICASRRGHSDIVKYLASHGADIDVKSRYGWTALITASDGGRLDTVEYLVSQGADVNAKDNDGWTALMAASQEGHLNIVEYLVSQGADIHTKDEDGQTALILASEGECSDVLEYLQSL